MKAHHASWHLLRKHKSDLKIRVFSKAREGVLLRKIELRGLEFDRANKAFLAKYAALQAAEVAHG